MVIFPSVFCMFTRDLLSKNWIQATISWSISTDILTNSWMALVNECKWCALRLVCGWSPWYNPWMKPIRMNCWFSPAIPKTSKIIQAWIDVRRDDSGHFFPPFLVRTYGIILRWRDQPLIIHGDLTCFRAVSERFLSCWGNFLSIFTAPFAHVCYLEATIWAGDRTEGLLP